MIYMHVGLPVFSGRVK